MSHDFSLIELVFPCRRELAFIQSIKTTVQASLSRQLAAHSVLFAKTLLNGLERLANEMKNAVITRTG